MLCSSVRSGAAGWTRPFGFTGPGRLGLAAILWRLSTGGWFNYALQAVVVGCVLTARALRARLDGATSWRPLLPVALAVAAVPAFAWTDLNQVVARRRSETADLARLLKAVNRPSSELFFVDLPGANRVQGRLDLVYDPWLYPVFESIGLAEPRSIWLEEALATGPVRVVATASSRPTIDGLGALSRSSVIVGLERLGPTSSGPGKWMARRRIKPSEAISPPNAQTRLFRSSSRPVTIVLS